MKASRFFVLSDWAPIHNCDVQMPTRLAGRDGGVTAGQTEARSGRMPRILVNIRFIGNGAMLAGGFARAGPRRCVDAPFPREGKCGKRRLVARVRAAFTAKSRRQFGISTNSRHYVPAFGQFPFFLRNAGENAVSHEIESHGTRDGDATASPVGGAAGASFRTQHL